MAKLLKKKSGFTLIELMIVVAILGILAALAIPAFIGYIRRSKGAEATGNLNSMFKSASSYYNMERGARPGGASMLSACTVGADTGTTLYPTDPGADKQEFTPSGLHTALGFQISDYVYFGYRINSTQAATCGLTAEDAPAYTFVAHGDLNGDNTNSTFELATDVSGRALRHNAGFYIVRETE
jgi:type IV pilus assembly protein PilA